MVTRICGLSALLLLGACATTDPGSGAGVTYALPRTDATVTMNLRLVDCDSSDPSRPATIELDTATTVAPLAGAQARRYEVSGSDLASARIRRTLKIGVNDAGAITSVNTSASDRTAQIGAGVIKTLVTIAPVMSLVDTRTGPFPACKPETAAALARADRLGDRIREIRVRLASSGANDGPSPEEERALVEMLPLLISELASLQTGVLHLTLSGRLVLDPPTTGDTRRGTLVLNGAPLGRWLTGSEVQLKEFYGPSTSLDWEAVRQATKPIPLAEWRANADPATRRDNRACGLDMPVPNPVPVRLSVSAPSGPPSHVNLPAAQWNEPRALCLDAGFGETRSIEMAFDAFGRTTSFGWTSEASGEALAGAASGVASDLVGYWRTEQNADLAEQQREILELETRQKLNKLRACEAIIAAGGYVCPP